jgi:hypothetical protein
MKLIQTSHPDGGFQRIVIRRLADVDVILLLAG